MQTHLTRPVALLLLAAAAGISACDRSPAAADDLVTAVRQATARFQVADRAIEAGYVPDDHCVAHPEMGGMGAHWINQALVDPEFDPMRPEVLLYAPVAGGAPRLVGVEYVVIDAGQEHPHFDGHPFDVGGVPPLMDAGVAHWSLHVWLHEANPNGLFAPFNPNVVCG